jgi:hypothetical protein
MTEQEAVRTQTLARVVGPYFIVMALTLAARQSTMALLLPAFMQDGPLVLAAGAFTLIIGLVILAAHHHFSSPASIVITIVGVAAALKGAFLMVLPTLGAPLTAAVVRTPPVLLILAVIMFLVGVWLSVIGWFAKRPARA